MRNSILALLVLAVSPAFANPVSGPQLIFDQPAFRGKGCPTGAAVSFAPDGNSMTIIFDSYLVEAGGTTRKRSANKTCTMRMPIQVPDGYTMALLEVDYRGFNGLPDGAKSHFQAAYKLRDRRAAPLNAITVQDWVGPLADVYLISNKPAINWRSSAGGTVILQVITNLKVTTNAAKDDAQSTIDTVDVAESRGVRPPVTGITYHFGLVKSEAQQASPASAPSSDEF